MTNPSVEVDVDEVERLQLTQSPRNGVSTYAVFSLNGVVALVEGLAVAGERINLGKQSLLDQRQAVVQPHLGGYPHPSKFTFRFHALELL